MITYFVFLTDEWTKANLELSRVWLQGLVRHSTHRRILPRGSWIQRFALRRKWRHPWTRRDLEAGSEGRGKGRRSKERSGTSWRWRQRWLHRPLRRRRHPSASGSTTSPSPACISPTSATSHAQRNRVHWFRLNPNEGRKNENLIFFPICCCIM